MTKQELGKKVDEYGVKRSKRSRRGKVMMVLASLVVFCTTYALILPALTWERTLICEKREHTHSDLCYTEIEVEAAELIRCGLDEHRHGEACLDENGALICEIPEHTHTAQCREIIPAHTEKLLTCEAEEHIHTAACFDAPPDGTDGARSDTPPMTDDDIPGCAEAPPGRMLQTAAGAAGGTISVTSIDCWQEVRTIDDTGTDYIIVSAGGYALGVNSSHAATSAAADLKAVSGYDGYYTTDLSEAFWWNFSATGTSSKQTDVGYGSYGLRLNNNTIISSTGNQTTNNLNYNQTGKYWRISSGSYYLSCNSSGTFSRSTSTGNANMKIYKATQIITVDGSAQDDPMVKPDYPDYLPVSAAKAGETAIGEVSGSYYSDAATSQLENYFTGVAEDDGKVLADKSVVYRGDDYSVFNSYAPNTFGVALSALGQKYAITKELEVSVPLDVVFVLDASGSMINSKYGGVTSANIMIESLNDIMKDVMDANADNRVGVVCYSGAATKLLDLGRYTADNDQYFPEGKCTSSDYQLAPSSSIRRTDGTLYKGTFTGGWYGTFTQDGIAMGAQEFFDTEDTTVSRTITKQTADGEIRANYTVKRRPVFILLSDGEPTYCTPDFANVLGCKRVYGDGTTGYDNNSNLPSINDLNNKGILGYYTILTAKNYKDRIAQHYGTDVFFYTIGIGINADGVNSYANSIAGDDYKRAVLNPTAENVAAIENCTNGISQGAARNQNISSFSDVTCHMLYRLLHDTQTDSGVTLKRHTSQVYGIRTSNTLATVPIIQNPYKDIGYEYADGAFFTATSSVEALTEALTRAISYKDTFPVYGFLLKNNLPMTVSDTIGDGMEIRSEPVLRYGGSNYAPVSHETAGNVTTYHYSGIWTAGDGSAQTADVSRIITTVTTDENGRQTVAMTIPDDLLPTYTPNLKNNGTASFYYEMLPVRLIYQVGLTDEAIAEVKALALKGGTKTFYTNTWTDEDLSYSVFDPTSFNPYYQNNDYDKNSLPKTENNTGTKENAFAFTEDSDNAKVSEILGNNGKLVFTEATFTTAPVTIWKVDTDGQPVTGDPAVFTVYADPELTIPVDTYETDGDGKLTIPALRTGRTYYLKETKAPYGYTPLADALPFTLDESGTVTGLAGNDGYALNDDGTISVRNEYAAATVEVDKQWAGALAPGEHHPASAEVRLYADGTAVQSPVILNAANGWHYKWENLPMLAQSDKHPIVYTVREPTVPEGYIPAITQSEDGVWIITNQKVGKTSLSVLKKWKGGKESAAYVELLLNGAPTGRYAELEEANGGYFIWEDLPDCDENGPVEYSIREIPVNGYTSDIHLWTGAGDPYGYEEVVKLTAADSFTDSRTYLIVFGGNALAANEDGDGLVAIPYDGDTEITEEMLWTASVGSGGAITLTGVSSGKNLVMNSSNRLAIGASSTHATSWRMDSSHRLYANYRSGGMTRSYYFTGTISNGVGTTSTTAGNGTPLSLSEWSKTKVADDVTTGDRHYIVVNTKAPYEPPDLNLTIRKISSEEIGSAQPALLNGAKFDLYIETGNIADGQIPGTDGRVGKVVQQFDCDGSATLTLSGDGVYYLVETAAPADHLLLKEAISFTVDSTASARTATIVSHPFLESGTTVSSLDVPNTPQKAYILPETGGGGIYRFYAAGILLILGAALCGLRVKRKRERGQSP